MAIPDDTYQRAVRCHQTGRLNEAEQLYRDIIQAAPGHAGAHHLLGLVAHQTGRAGEAVALMDRAIALCPGAAVFHCNLGAVLKEQGHLMRAAACFRQALQLDPAHVDALCGLGALLRAQGELAEAIQCYRQALALNPNHPQAHNNLGNVLRDQGALDEAAQSFREALRIDPHYANAHYNLGILHKDLGKLDEGAACFRQALANNPRHVDARNNLAAALMYLGHLAEAGAQYDEALQLDPNNYTALWNRGLWRLLHGDFERGWRDYEYRWTQPGFSQRHQDLPRWDGSALAGRTILVHAEQGLGDTIQFIRYAPLVKERGGHVVVECQPTLERLLTGIAGVDRLVPAGGPVPAAHVQAPLLSLPGIFSTTLATIPPSVPYLRAEPALVAKWRQRLAPVRGFKIGIAWQGSLAYKGDRYRSIPLAHFATLAKLDGARLVSLQKGPGTEQLAANVGGPSQFPVIDLADRLDMTAAFVDTAAVLMNLDLVVTSDTAVAHVAGALGIPVWLLLSKVPDWRWLLERTDSPWYPTMRLFRQQRAGDWGEVFDRCAAEIRGLTQVRGQRSDAIDNPSGDDRF